MGIQVAPVIGGLNDSLPALEALLRRARSSGASYAAAAPLSMTSEARRRLVKFVAQFDPERATRYDRIFARSMENEPGYAERLKARFTQACEHVGLRSNELAVVPPQPGDPQAPGPRQLSLFPQPSSPSRAA